MNERIMGSIGSTQPELSRYILDDTDILFHIKKTLQGHEMTIGEDGKITYKEGNGKVYSDKCIHFVLDATFQALNKNMKLSNYKDKEIQRTAWLMCDDFVCNLWMQMKELDINELDIPVLGSMYRNLVDQAIRRPLDESDKRFLKDTFQETSQRIHQDISENQNKGGLFGIFKR